MKIAMIAIEPTEPVSSLARALGEQGHEVTLHVRREQPGKRRSTLAPGVVVDPVPAGPERHLEGPDLYPHLGVFGDRLAERWRRTEPDIAHAHGLAGGLATLTASRRIEERPARRRPAVQGSSLEAVLCDQTPTRSAAGPWRLPILQTYGRLAAHRAGSDSTAHARLERAIGRAAPASSVACDTDRELLVRLGVPRARIAVLPMGVDTGEFTEKGPIAPRGSLPRLLMLTGPTAAAGFAVRMMAWIPGAELVIAGGPAPAALETDADTAALRLLAKEEGVDDRVILLGRQSRRQVPRLIRSADLVLALHDYDPFGRVALEAMACGVPVVANRAGGHLTTVIDEVTGLLVSRVGPDELARRVRGLLADPIRREALGIAAADRARSRHSWDRIARETLGVYTKIAS